MSAPKWQLPEGVQSIAVNGYDMAYREMGSGPPLMLVHGMFQDYRCWTSQMQDFAAKHRVIAVSLRHYYPEKWDGVGDDFSILQHANDVAAFVKALGLGKVHLLGHSRGGTVALNVAKLHPDVIRTLVLADGGGAETLLPETPEGRKLAQQMQDMFGEIRKAVAAGNFDGAGEMLVDAVNGPGAWANLPPERKAIVLDNVATGAAPDPRPPTTCEQVKRFDFPILFVTGERSPKRYGEMIAALRRCKDAPEPIVIPNAAHTMNRDNPAVFNAAVLQFLSDK